MSSIDDLAIELDERLAAADGALERGYPGDRGARQPVHTVYVPADRFSATTAGEWGRQALAVLEQHGGADEDAGESFGLAPEAFAEVRERVVGKLTAEPIEDLRIDFEDGLGDRPDDEEDAAALSAGSELGKALRTGQAPPFHGIRFKSFESPTRRRGLRTLDLFVGELARQSGVTSGLVVTLPKVSSVEQVEAMVLASEWLEREHGLDAGRLRFEIQVETPQSILGADGTALVARMIHASDGRCAGLHYGTYDYSASCGVSAAYQSMEHPSADHAKAVMQVAAAGTGVFVSDGSTNVLPLGEREQVRVAWRLHHRLVRRSLERGFYQGWDLHPAQLPTRFLATYAFYREGFGSAAARLRAYVHGGDSGFLDEPATAAALAGFVLRGLECGALGDTEVVELIGIDSGRLAKLAKRGA
ncbi:DUF6986 family protein [Parasphingorhabdus pacifica]